MAIPPRRRHLAGLVAAGILGLLSGCAEPPHETMTPALAAAPEVFDRPISRLAPDQVLFTQAIGYYLNAERGADRLSTLVVEPYAARAAASYSQMMADRDQNGLYAVNHDKDGYELPPGNRIDRSVRFVGFNDIAFVMPLGDGACRVGTMPSYAELARRATLSMMANWRQEDALNRFMDRFGAGIAFDTRKGCDVALISLSLIGGTPQPPREIGPLETWVDSHFD